MELCEECDNLLDISKTSLIQKSKIMDDKTPSTVSATEGTSDESDSDEIGNILSKLIENEKMDTKIFQLHNYDDFIKHQIYIKLEKKKKMELNTQLQTIYGKINDTISAYYICLKCSFSKEIPSGKMIMYRKNTINDTEPYIDIRGIKNKRFSKILAHTSDYICVNKKCESHKDKTKKDAVIYRTPKIIKIYYICVTCGEWYQVSQ